MPSKVQCLLLNPMNVHVTLEAGHGVLALILAPCSTFSSLSIVYYLIRAPD